MVDPRTTALVETPLDVQLPGGPSSAATVVRAEADVIQARVELDRPGLAVFGELYYPTWSAFVDGQPAPLFVVDGLLRGVMVPTGEHVVEVRFASVALVTGIAISVVTALVLGGVSMWRLLR
jgi:hypothetical protein